MLRFARRPRAFVRVAGPDAASFLQRMVSNDVEAVAPGSSCDALLLTPKSRLIAPLRVLRRSDEDFLLLTEPELGERVLRELTRYRLASKAEIATEEHRSHVVLGAEPPAGAIPSPDYGVAAYEQLDAPPPAGAAPIDDGDLEVLRIEARTPVWGRELDERVLPAEAGLVERAVSFTKGCYPGQEPIARLHYRGRANRGLRVLDVDAAEPPATQSELRLGEKVVGRITSSARDAEGRIRALGYVRTDVPSDASLTVDGGRARIAS